MKKPQDMTMKEAIEFVLEERFNGETHMPSKENEWNDPVRQRLFDKNKTNAPVKYPQSKLKADAEEQWQGYLKQVGVKDPVMVKQFAKKLASGKDVKINEGTPDEMVVTCHMKD